MGSLIVAHPGTNGTGFCIHIPGFPGMVGQGTCPLHTVTCPTSADARTDRTRAGSLASKPSAWIQVLCSVDSEWIEVSHGFLVWASSMCAESSLYRGPAKRAALSKHEWSHYTMAKNHEELKNRLRSIDGRGYRAYAQITGEYEFPHFLLAVDHVQGDPFASASRIRVRVPGHLAQFSADLMYTPVRRVATEDFIIRQCATAIQRIVKGHRGTGHSGSIAIDVGGQEILERTACKLTSQYVEIRLSIGLPAAGRTVLGREAAAMLLDEIPRLVDSSLLSAALDQRALADHVAGSEDQDAIRRQLQQRHLLAFIADGSVLPRASGVSDLPLASPKVVKFVSPPELRVQLHVPNRGIVSGMGIPEGVNLIVGGGYHGKSTLLNAIARCVYPHVPGDGREWVVTREDAAKVRAEDGRSVQKVDISPFIDNLPFGQGTVAFTTENASGSTSQAANIVEALDSGSRLILMDEDTSATNFMIRDARMQRLIPKSCEPITPFIDQVRNLFVEKGVSCIIVVGGSGDYFDVADTVIAMHNYEPSVVTSEAKRVAQELPTHRIKESGSSFGRLARRAVVSDSLDPFRRGRVRVGARGLHTVDFGRETINLQNLEQLVDPSQTRAIASMLLYALNRGYFEHNAVLSVALGKVLEDVRQGGLDVISPFQDEHPGDYALPRMHELAAALNRLRSLRIHQVDSA